MKRKRLKTITAFYSFIFFFIFTFSPFQQTHSEWKSEFHPPENQSHEEHFNIKDFFITTLYGTFLGSVVGTATLTFSKYPTKNLRRIAQGASIGLYLGILFGLTSFYGNSSSKLRERFEDKEFVESYKNYRFLFKNHLLFENHRFKYHNLKFQ